MIVLVLAAAAAVCLAGGLYGGGYGYRPYGGYGGYGYGYRPYGHYGLGYG